VFLWNSSDQAVGRQRLAQHLSRFEFTLFLFHFVLKIPFGENWKAIFFLLEVCIRFSLLKSSCSTFLHSIIFVLQVLRYVISHPVGNNAEMRLLLEQMGRGKGAKGPNPPRRSFVSLCLRMLGMLVINNIKSWTTDNVKSARVAWLWRVGFSIFRLA